MDVFLSYARRDQPSIARLRADLQTLGHRVWFDRQYAGDQRWWDSVLSEIRHSTMFVFAVSPDSVRSKACLAELRYARALGRPILAVNVHPVDRSDLPAALTVERVLVDYLVASPQTTGSLRTAVNALPSARPLPYPLPKEPEIPTSYLNAYLTKLDATVLDHDAQAELLSQLRARLDVADERAAVWDLLVRLRDRPELAAPIADQIELLLEPGWHPDPQERHDGRYWDGASWTTLVMQDGREFNDRSLPPREHAHLPPRPVPPSPPRKEKPVPHKKKVDAKTRRLVVIGVSVAVVVGGGVAAGTALIGTSDPTTEAKRVARDFVDAVNTHDKTAVQQFVCARDRANNAHLYGAFVDTANVTLERVDAAGDRPTFTILAARTVGSTSVRLSIPLAQENGEWRVCDINAALSGR